jgi:hypothetical protein
MLQLRTGCACVVLGAMSAAPQLDILALEPFYGGARRAMLETMVRCSRHRWTVLKLPPRRIDRRLSAAATWFAEQLSRHWVGKIDLLFTSEAMNLASLYQLMPQLARKPSVVYFHENQLPDVHTNTDAPLDLVNLNTANAAGEIWFNSVWHQRTFLARAAAFIERHPELSSQNPLPELARKASVMPPPIDFSGVTEAMSAKVDRDGTTIFVETRDADIGLLNKALALLQERDESFRLITVGPADSLDDRGAPRQALAEADDAAQGRGLCEAGVFLSVKPDAASDFLAVRALAAGCRPVFPASGFYGELLSAAMQRSCLYDFAPEPLADHLAESLSPFQTERPGDHKRALASFDPAVACRQIDERFEELVWVRAVD